jgi:hypothetical protein
LIVVLLATKSAGHGATQIQSMITHQCEHLQKVVSAMQMFRKAHGRKEDFVTQETFVIHHVCNQWIL